LRYQCAGIGVDCHTAICQPLGPFAQTSAAVTGDDHCVVAVNLHVLDGALDFQILEHALFANGDVLGAVVRLRTRVGVDEVSPCSFSRVSKSLAIIA
jgi:hypothetical protein